MKGIVHKVGIVYIHSYDLWPFILHPPCAQYCTDSKHLISQPLCTHGECVLFKQPQTETHQLLFCAWRVDVWATHCILDFLVASQSLNIFIVTHSNLAPFTTQRRNINVAQFNVSAIGGPAAEERFKVWTLAASHSAAS